MPLPSPLARQILKLTATTVGIPSHVKVTQWGAPLDFARHVIFYFGGMPASAEEPALHSAAATHGADVYAARRIHLVCLDKPGMGESAFNYRFQIRRDWPVVVRQVADQLSLLSSSSSGSSSSNANRRNRKIGVMGMSNGGPYVMAALTHPELCDHIQAGCMIVGVSDVCASGYFSWRTPSTFFEGCYNSLPLIVTGPLNALGLKLGSFYLFSLGGFDKVFPRLSGDSREGIRRWLQDAGRHAGLGSALDCQQGLSPLFARSTANQAGGDHNDDNHVVDGPAAQAYRNIQVPVTLWYGTKDDSVPMHSAEWLAAQIPNSTLHTLDEGHGLFLFRPEAVLDDFVSVLERAAAGDGDNDEKAAEESD